MCSILSEIFYHSGISVNILIKQVGNGIYYRNKNFKHNFDHHDWSWVIELQILVVIAK